MTQVRDAKNLVEVVQGLDNDDVGGYVTIEAIRDGARGPEVVARSVSHNLVTTMGKRQIWRVVQGLQANLFDQMRIGTSGQAPGSADINVLSPVTGTLITVDSVTLLAGTRTAQWVVSYPSGPGSKSATGIQEVVLLNQNTSPGGSAMMRSVFTPVNKTTADKLKITYNARIT